MRCWLTNSSYTVSTNVGGETSLGRWRVEGIVKRRQTRPRILCKAIEREKGKQVGYQIYSAAATRLSLSLPLSVRQVFFKPDLHYRLVNGGNFDPSIVHFRHDSSSARHRNEESV